MQSSAQRVRSARTFTVVASEIDGTAAAGFAFGSSIAEGILEGIVAWAFGLTFIRSTCLVEEKGS